MVIDTSALIAIPLDGPERRRFNELIEADQTRLVSAASYVGSALVLDVRRRYGGLAELDRFLETGGIDVVPVDAAQARAAASAFRAYGRGRHRAWLNVGDCFAYALAVTSGEPLLYKGGDFDHTDVPAAAGES
jgi:ribonuclease VapC